MNIEKLVKNIGRFYATLLFKKDVESTVKVDLNQIGSTDIVGMFLRRLINEGNYNKAENILFKELKKNNSAEMYQTAVDFYNLLLEKSDAELYSGNFSREEIYQGLEDIKEFKC